MLVLILRNGFEFRLSDLETGVLIGGAIFAGLWFFGAHLSVSRIKLVETEQRAEK